jgi:hypothetical protein
MGEVQQGDAIFMFAKGVGIIGIGRAIDRYETLEPSDPGRVSMIMIQDQYPNDREWRVPVAWLDWRGEANPYSWNESPPWTFFNITGNAYHDLRTHVREHYLND